MAGHRAAILFNHTLWINKFIEKYNKNRFVITIQEDFFQSLDVKQIPDYGAIFKQIYIQYIGKSQIREMVTKWADNREDIIDVDDTVNKIDAYCNQINFAKTPFNIAIFMVIWDEDNNFIFFVYLHLSNLYRKLTYISVRVGYI